MHRKKMGGKLRTPPPQRMEGRSPGGCPNCSGETGDTENSWVPPPPRGSGSPWMAHGCSELIRVALQSFGQLTGVPGGLWGGPGGSWGSMGGLMEGEGLGRRGGSQVPGTQQRWCQRHRRRAASPSRPQAASPSPRRGTQRSSPGTRRRIGWGHRAPSPPENPNHPQNPLQLPRDPHQPPGTLTPPIPKRAAL